MHPYALDGEYEEWTLTFDAELPASTLITIAVATAAEDESGNPVAADTEFSFTTGDAADTTPPQLLSIEPADGTTIPVSTSYIRITFDEPIDDSSLQPSVISGQFMLSMADPEDAGVWSDNLTVLTVGLAPPLAPGAIFYVEFDDFADLQGNVNTDGFTWGVTVEGTPDFMPVADTFLMYYLGHWESGTNREEGTLEALTKYEVKTGGEFWRWQAEYQFGPIKAVEVEFYEYDRFRETTSAIQFLGFHEEDPPPKEVLDVTFNPPIDWLKLPVTPQSWSGTSTFLPVPDEGPTQVEYEMAILDGVTDVVGPDLDVKQSDSVIHWMGCRTLVVDYTLTDGVYTYVTATDSIWFCPGVGPVRRVSEDVEEGEWYTETLDLFWAGLEADFPD